MNPITIRRSSDRGHADFGWLNTYHTFSFGTYQDPNFMGFQTLRVINEDRLLPGQGFPEHFHRDMEIISYVLEGSLAHKDSMGNGSVIVPGDIQYMRAGSGVTHSEYNQSEKDPVHFIQIWIIPREKGGTPHYEQKHFTSEEKRQNLRLIISGDGAEGSIKINQDVKIYSCLLEQNQKIDFTLKPQSSAWLQIIRGQVSFGETIIHQGDGATLAGPGNYSLYGRELTQETEFLLFDL